MRALMIVMALMMSTAALADDAVPGVFERELVAEYKDNEIAADAKWKGRKLLIRGRVDRAEKMLGDSVLWLGAPMERAMAVMKDPADPALMKVKRGMDVILACTVGKPTLTGVRLNGCEFVPLAVAKQLAPRLMK